MNKVDKMSKEVLGIVEYCKEVVRKNLISSNDNQQDRLSESQLNNMLNIVNLSLSQGSQKAIPVFQKVLSNVLNETAKEAVESSKKKK